ncbi:MAG: sugar ABC transporter ATP-binding protein, partial [Victivallales bacterium]|nr:sugar ABC transporter ATP-binding protein [Victivallales bacterium]
VGELSLAEQQLVEVGRAVAVGCRLLVLDEPTSSLTSRDAEALFSLIMRLRGKGHAIIYISHFLEEVTTISDRFVVLRDGRSVGGGESAGFGHDRIVELMVGRSVDQLYPRSHRNRGEEILHVEGLAGHGKPLDAGFSLCRGEVLGIAGLVGAGRTEMLETIFGLRPIVCGWIKFAAYTGPAAPGKRLRQGMGMLSEDRKNEGLALSLSLADNITMSKTPMFETPASRAARAEKWIKDMAIRCQGPWQQMVSLSGGNQQKVAIARLLHHDVDVLLLDEPTRGIDVGAKAMIYAIIEQLASLGKSIIIVSSYLPELMGICDRVAVMRKGRLGTPRLTEQTNEHEIMLEATGS